MKRYRIVGIIGAPTNSPMGKCPCDMREDHDGEWVKWDDVECNCEDMFHKCNMSVKKKEKWPYINWFCPTHGYKKL
jgi:hypothetical protein